MSVEEQELVELYTYLTPEVLEQFDGAGTETLLQLIDSKTESESNGIDIISTLFTELLMALEEEKLRDVQIMEFLSSAIKDDDLATVFCQILSVFPLSERLQKLLLDLYTEGKVIKQSTLHKVVSGDYLAKAGIIPADTLTRQLNTRRRDQFYTQKKFNLLHEESEGFSRLIVEMYNFTKAPEAQFQIDYILNVIESLMGHYNLDPNKCLDIVFECIFNNLVGNHEAMLEFLRKSRWWPSVESDNSALGTLSVGGNDTAAKLLGLKYLKIPLDRDLSETFKLFVAICIKEGLISFGSIYFFFTREEDEMEKIEKLYQKDLEDRVFKSSANALALAAPLLDEEDASAASTQNGTVKSEPKPHIYTLEEKLRSSHTFQMLKAFLSIGLYWPSIYILTEYPFLAKVDTEINELICRLYHNMIEPLYSSVSQFSADDLAKLQTGGKIAAGMPYNSVSFSEYPSTTLLTSKATLISYSQKKFVFFYSKWTTGLPVIITSDDLFTRSQELLKFIDVNLAKDAILFSKICDIGYHDIASHPNDEAVSAKWFQYFRNVIFPAISLIEQNPIIVDKAYRVLSFYPKEDRFNLYSELHQVLSKNNPLIKISYGKAEKSTKDVLKRLSKETVRPMMRRIAKISFSNPLPCFLTALQQIESYDNLNNLVVETARYFNGYGWDALTLAILMRLTAPGRSNVQTDGLHERQWIQSLSSFIGKICQRYPNAIDVGTIIEYLLKSFHSNETVGLIVLKEILISMGGIQPISNLTLEQINRINCGGVLEKIVYSTINDFRYERAKSGDLLIATLSRLDCINELLVLLCRAENSVVFDSNEEHLKVLANKKDELNTVIQLFTSLVSFFKEQSNTATLLAPIDELIINYNIAPEWAFELWRSFLDKTNTGSINDVVGRLRSSGCSYIPEAISDDLYGKFWALSLYDINFPSDLYEVTLKKVAETIPSLESRHNKTKRSREALRSEIDKTKRDLDEAKTHEEEIKKNKEAHSLRTNTVSEIFEKDSKGWFSGDASAIRSFLQTCILPRAVHSAYDAVYSAKFLFTLHTAHIQHFNLIVALNQLTSTKVLLGTIFTSTAMEAENLGMFFAEILTSLHAWRKPVKFEDNSYWKDEYGSSLSFDQFRSILFKYHEAICNEVSKGLSTTEYMCRRNSITFMRSLLGVYPVVEDHCETIVELIDNIVKNEAREDLKLSASALIGHIRSHSKEWEHMWDFMEMKETDKNEQVAKREKIETERKKKAEEEARKREEERLAREKKEKESLELKLKKEQEEKEIERLKENEKKGLTYSESKATPRPDTRSSNDSSRSRFDYYSAYAKRKDGSEAKTSDVAPKPDSSAEKKSESDSSGEKKLETNGKDEDKSKARPILMPKGPRVHEDKGKEKVRESAEEREKKFTDKKLPEKKQDNTKPVLSKAEALKTRIQAAKEELNIGKEKSRPSTNSRTSTPTGPSSNSDDKAPNRARAPLPPQASIARDTSSRQSSYYKPNSQSHRPNRPYTPSGPSKQSSPLPPPPPPPPPPAGGAKDNGFDKGGRYDNKRKYEGGGGRTYDNKRQRY